MLYRGDVLDWGVLYNCLYHWKNFTLYLFTAEVCRTLSLNRNCGVKNGNLRKLSEVCQDAGGDRFEGEETNDNFLDCTCKCPKDSPSFKWVYLYHVQHEVSAHPEKHIMVKYLRLNRKFFSLKIGSESSQGPLLSITAVVLWGMLF